VKAADSKYKKLEKVVPIVVAPAIKNYTDQEIEPQETNLMPTRTITAAVI